MVNLNFQSVEELAKFVVDELFACGETGEPEKVGRIQFMLGDYPNELVGGGMAKDPLIKFIFRKLETRRK